MICVLGDAHLDVTVTLGARFVVRLPAAAPPLDEPRCEGAALAAPHPS